MNFEKYIRKSGCHIGVQTNFGENKMFVFKDMYIIMIANNFESRRLYRMIEKGEVWYVNITESNYTVSGRAFR